MSDFGNLPDLDERIAAVRFEFSCEDHETATRIARIRWLRERLKEIGLMPNSGLRQILDGLLSEMFDLLVEAL